MNGKTNCGVYIFKEILFSLSRERSSDICFNMDGLEGQVHRAGVEEENLSLWACLSSQGSEVSLILTKGHSASFNINKYLLSSCADTGGIALRDIS